MQRSYSHSEEEESHFIEEDDSGSEDQNDEIILNDDEDEEGEEENGHPQRQLENESPMYLADHHIEVDGNDGFLVDQPPVFDFAGERSIFREGHFDSEEPHAVMEHIEEEDEEDEEDILQGDEEEEDAQIEKEIIEFIRRKEGYRDEIRASERRPHIIPNDSIFQRRDPPRRFLEGVSSSSEL